MQSKRERTHGPGKLTQVLSYEEVPVNRHMDCQSYPLCLELAASRRWHSFTCTECSRWQEAMEQKHLPEAAERAAGM